MRERRAEEKKRPEARSLSSWRPKGYASVSQFTQDYVEKQFGGMLTKVSETALAKGKRAALDSVLGRRANGAGFSDVRLREAMVTVASDEETDLITGYGFSVDDSEDGSVFEEIPSRRSREKLSTLRGRLLLERRGPAHGNHKASILRLRLKRPVNSPRRLSPSSSCFSSSSDRRDYSMTTIEAPDKLL